MTCIVAWAEEDKICIGGDSAGVAGYRMQIRADEKIFKNGEMVFGFTSSFRMGQLLRFSLNLPSKKEKQDDYDYMCTDFINAVRDCLKKGGYATIKDGEDRGGCFIVGFRNNLYNIESDFQVGKTIKPYHAIGCGESFALGACQIMTKTSLPLKIKVQKALEIAYDFSAGVRPPYHFIEI